MKRFRWKSWWKVMGLSAILLTGGIHISAAEEFMPVQDIQTGMQGIAKTVVEGNAISTFQVKVLGVMKQQGPSGDLILAEFSGPVIDKSGGIAHGMSGSPVYINGKLVGAVAYGWGFSRSHIGMITPIRQMVTLWDEPYAQNVPNPWQSDRRLIPLGTPFMAYGFDKEALQYMQNKLTGYHITPYATASAAADAEAQPLYPGSSVAATLVDGDLKLGAIGTVTYTDGNRIVAFGHPYLKEGSTGYFMHNSYIFTIINNMESSFKLGSIGHTIGAITEDRGAGIAGTVGLVPQFIPVTIDTEDLDRGITKESHVRVIRDNSLSPSLVTTSVYNFLTKTLDRKGGGTARISYTIQPTDKKLAPYVRQDMFFNSEGIALKSVDEFYTILDRLMNNSFLNYNIKKINVAVDVTKERRTAQILDAVAAPIIVSPGDAIQITVNLHPYRGEDFSRTLTFTVPKDQPLGDMVLEVRGGGVTPLPYLIERQKVNLTDEVIRRLHVYKTFDEYFKRLKNIDANNQIVVEILDNSVSMVPEQNGGSSNKAKLTSLGNRPIDGPEGLKKGNSKKPWDAFDGDENRAILNTEYVILGDGQFKITVVSPAKKEKALRKLMQQRQKEKKVQEKTETPPKKSLVQQIQEAGQAAYDKADKPPTKSDKQRAKSDKQRAKSDKQ